MESIFSKFHSVVINSLISQKVPSPIFPGRQLRVISPFSPSRTSISLTLRMAHSTQNPGIPIRYSMYLIDFYKNASSFVPIFAVSHLIHS